MTRDDECEGCCVAQFPVQDAQQLTLVSWEDAESLYGGAQKGGQEQGSQEWNQNACPSNCTYHELAEEGFLKPL